MGGSCCHRCEAIEYARHTLILERNRMFELGGIASVVAQLEQAREQLTAISRRVAVAAHAAPRRDASGWAGLAAEAYQRSLDQLARELEVAQELLRSATDLTEAALFEVGGHA